MKPTLVAIAAAAAALPASGTAPATSAKLFHPHDIAVGPDGAVYIADSENGRIRRVDPATGAITSFGGNVGVPVSLEVARDGTVFSAGVARGSTPAGVWRTTAEGSTIIANGQVNSVTVAADGTIYVCQWPEWRVGRIDTARGIIRTILRGAATGS